MLSLKVLKMWRLCQFFKWHNPVSFEAFCLYTTLVDWGISLNSSIELNETNYCDQKPITIEFTFEEHDLFNDILNHAIEAIDFALGSSMLEFDYLEDSEIRKRYEMLENMKNYSCSLWAQRFGN
jgi:hypothetical protein